jgi:hypothetical protein
LFLFHRYPKNNVRKQNNGNCNSKGRNKLRSMCSHGNNRNAEKPARKD